MTGTASALERRSEFYGSHAQYRIGRPPGSGTDLPVLLLHGLGGRCGQLWPWFCDGPRTVIAPDQRGHGDWTFGLTPQELTFEQLAHDQLRLLDRLDQPAVMVAGVSMGAGVAVAMARIAPNRIASLLLIRPAWLDRPFPPNLDILVRVGELLDRSDEADLMRELTSTEEYRAVAAASPAAAASVRSQLDQPLARALSARLSQLPGSAPISDLSDLRSIDVPTTVVGADGDPMHPSTIARTWADAIPRAGYESVPSRDVRPQEYDAALRALCARFVAEPSGG